MKCFGFGCKPFDSVLFTIFLPKINQNQLTYVEVSATDIIDTRCYFNMHSKADISQLYLLHVFMRHSVD